MKAKYIFTEKLFLYRLAWEDNNISLVLYLHVIEEAVGMSNILAHNIRMKKNPQTKEDTFWIFTEVHGVMQFQIPTCTPAR